MIKKNSVLLFLLCTIYTHIIDSGARVVGQQLVTSVMKSPIIPRSGPRISLRNKGSWIESPSGTRVPSRHVSTRRVHTSNKGASQWSWLGNNARGNARRIPFSAKVATGGTLAALAIYLKQRSYLNKVEQELPAMQAHLDTISPQEIEKRMRNISYLADKKHGKTKERAINVEAELQDLRLSKKYGYITPETVLPRFQQYGAGLFLNALVIEIPLENKRRSNKGQLYIPKPLLEALKIVKNNPEARAMMLEAIEQKRKAFQKSVDRNPVQTSLHKGWLVRDYEQTVAVYDLIKKELEEAEG